MKRVVIVGPQSSLGRELGKAFAKEGAKIAFISDAQNCGLRLPAGLSAESVLGQCQELQGQVALFSGDLTLQEDWKAVAEKAVHFLGGGVDHFCFLHGVVENCNLSSSRNGVAADLMNLNFVIGCLALSSFLPTLRDSSSHLTIFACDGGILEKQSSVYLANDGKTKESPEVSFANPALFYPKSANQLCQAIYHQDIARAKEILKGFKRNPDMLTETDDTGRNIFHYVAYSGCSSLLEQLMLKVRKRNLIDSTDKLRWTPLHYAACHGHLKMVRRLLREGSDPNMLTCTGTSAMHLLARIEPQGEDNKISINYIQTLKMLIELGADTNQRNKDWCTPLHEAAATGSLKALTLFLKNEGDPHRKTKKHGRTPLWVAVKNRHTPIVELLLEHGSDPINCVDFAPDSMKPLLEEYREKNCRPESAVDDSKKEVVIIRSMDDFPSAAAQMIKNSGLMNSSKELVEENWNLFLFVLRFLTRKIYRTPEQAKVSRAKRDVGSRTTHGKTLDEATAAFVTNGNPRKMFKLLEDVGRGGFGSVSMVKRIGDKKNLFALKKVPHLTEKEQWSNLDEVYFLQQCSHNCVVKYENAYVTRDEMWIVMEYLEGGSLSQTVQKFQLEEGQICYVTREILRGLRYMHKNNFVHRDLKSANIMLSVHGDIRIIDFGLCVEMGEEEQKGIVGSPFWIPPEMIKKSIHGAAADIWSLGILCLEMAHGKPPHRDSALRSMFNVGVGIPPKLDAPDSWSDDFKDFLGKMLVINPEERATANDLLRHPWIGQAYSRKSMQELLHTLFVNQSLEKQLGIV